MREDNRPSIMISASLPSADPVRMFLGCDDPGEIGVAKARFNFVLTDIVHSILSTLIEKEYQREYPQLIHARFYERFIAEEFNGVPRGFFHRSTLGSSSNIFQWRNGEFDRINSFEECFLVDKEGRKLMLEFNQRYDEDFILSVIVHKDNINIAQEFIRKVYDYFKNQKFLVTGTGTKFVLDKKYDWSDIHLNKNLKRLLYDSIIRFLEHPELFNKHHLFRNGVLLHGPAGTGKTLLGKVLASQSKVSFIWAMSSHHRFFSFGDLSINDLFVLARAIAPCILFIEDIDTLFERQQYASAFLNQMDGIVSSEGIFVIATTNNINLLSAPFLRPGRFDEKIYIGFPDRETKLKILQTHIKTCNIAPDVSIEEIVEAMNEKFTGADIALSVRKALLLASKRWDGKGDLILTKEDLLSAVHSIKNNLKPDMGFQNKGGA